MSIGLCVCASDFIVESECVGAREKMRVTVQSHSLITHSLGFATLANGRNYDLLSARSPLPRPLKTRQQRKSTVNIVFPTEYKPKYSSAPNQIKSNKYYFAIARFKLNIIQIQTV